MSELIKMPDWLVTSIYRNSFFDVSESIKKKYAHRVKNIPNDNKDRYLTANAVYITDDVWLFTVLFLIGNQIIKIAKVKIDCR